MCDQILRSIFVTALQEKLEEYRPKMVGINLQLELDSMDRMRVYLQLAGVSS
jgi:hypothetical protein